MKPNIFHFKVLMLVGAVLCSLSLAASGGDGAAPRVAEETARKIALDLVRGGRVARGELRQRKDGGAVYAYVIVDDANRTNVLIDAANGDVLRLGRKSIESIKRPRDPDRRGEIRDTRVTPAQARSMALEKVGEGEVVGVEKDFRKDGRAIYKVELFADAAKYRMEIDADSGDMLQYSEKPFGSRERDGIRAPRTKKAPGEKR